MRFSKRSTEGYLLIDHRNSPGVSDDDLAPLRASGRFAPTVGAGQMLECPTSTCAHCNTTMILNPNRQRARGHCFKCNRYICDSAACHFECTPFDQMLDHRQEQIFRAMNGYAALPPLLRAR